ncbi:MAG: ActS/PrrB/RegB family redox-sensitive histidine kinase [Rhodobacteraceae bacterium]|nr:ActS/PrrB/RegB family redox-sensitive histidine kinase [Paracoccaceae bacterium]
MPDRGSPLTQGRERSSWIRLRTLILLRWVAIIGQVTAISVAQQLYHLQLDMLFCFFAVGASVVVNLIAMFAFPENKRLSEYENFLMIMFDVLQLGFLLYLTGGLHNPFALLLLGPVIISANVMGLRSTLIIGGTTILLVTLLGQNHLPLIDRQGGTLRIPDLFVFGNWVAMVIAIVFIGAYSLRISSETQSMSDALAATNMALSREQKLTDLGGVVAAAAHELGTPLATIKLASAELMEELDDRPDLQEDAALIRQQADRCRDILRDMGRAGKDDLHLRQAPISTVIQEAAEPHMHRGKIIHFSERPEHGASLQQPSILRKPEVIHGLRNLIQNAVDFSKANVWIEAMWSGDSISIRIQDDGSGFPPHFMGRIGDPFMRFPRSEADQLSRPGYEGMGLGLFIAKTLLERSGAELSFANADNPRLKHNTRHSQQGAVVDVIWPRSKIDAQMTPHAIPTGANQPIRV